MFNFFGLLTLLYKLNKEKKKICSPLSATVAGGPSSTTRNSLPKSRVNFSGKIFPSIPLHLFFKNDKIVANGGRVLNFVSISDSYFEARKSAINNIKDLNWDGGFFRKDIGFRAID